jgi:hypothetical protein
MRLKSLMVLVLVSPVYSQNSMRKCSDAQSPHTINGHLVEDEGKTGYPLTGWVGYTNTGDPIKGVVIECFRGGWSQKVASTRTDASGKFTFPKLKEGTYYLKGTKDGLSTIQSIVHVTREVDAVACLTGEADPR